jgi:hypothetical protein
MEMQTDLPASFDCRATAALLRSGRIISLAGHAAAVMSVVPIWKDHWVAVGAIVLWCNGVVLAVLVEIDAQFFEVLAEQPPEYLDRWLQVAGFRRRSPSKTIPERRQGALKLWRALVAAVAWQIALLFVAMLRSFR